MEELEKLKKELAEVLKADIIDNDKVLVISKEIAGLDKENVRFSVDAGVIDRLGKELVARHETAVSELIKNSFDADAVNASLFFENVDRKGGTFIIKDNGNGMNRAQLVNGFMRISSTEKIHEPTSPVFKRKRAGRKGIGRFSAQRLGAKLTIITQTSNSIKALKITINWDEYKKDSDLILISNSIEEIPRDKNKVSGTILQIDELREWWSVAMIKRVYRYALDIVQPFPLSKKKMVDNVIQDVGFKIDCFKDGERVVDANSMFYEHALAEIEGYVEKGNAFWEIPKSKVKNTKTKTPVKIFKDENKPEKEYEFLNGINLKAYYYITGKRLIPKQVESYIREFLNQHGGIRLYRNGFRVLPYAEPQNDWIGLDESVRRKSILPVHGNNNFFGFIEIEGANKDFQELSSREGLLNNEAYNELIDFAYKALTAAVLRIQSERGVKTKSNQKGWKSKASTKDKAASAILEAADEFEQIAESLENEDSKSSGGEEKESSNKSENKKKADDFREKAEKLRAVVDEIEELNMIRVLAGLGLIIGEFTHEIEQYLSTFKVDSQFLIDNLNSNSEEYKTVKKLRKTFESIEVYSSYFDETISQNVNRELEPIELRDAILPFVKTITPDLKRNNIELITEYAGIDIFTCKMHISEWGSILFNLYSNAKKAIKRTNNKGQILIKAGEQGDIVFLEFSDTGDGIPEENRNKIFNAFFTTSSPKGHKRTMKNESSGTGLGLKILSDIINSYGGDISLENSEEKYSTTLRIEVPKATKEEKEKYAL